MPSEASSYSPGRLGSRRASSGSRRTPDSSLRSIGYHLEASRADWSQFHRYRLGDLLQHFVAMAERLHLSVANDQQLVDGTQGRGAVGDDDDDAAALPYCRNGARQRRVPFGIEIGIRLVQNDE